MLTVKPVPIALEGTLEEDIRWLLVQRILKSETFHRAEQLRKILSYVSREIILHPDQTVREYEVAFNALGRRKDFDADQRRLLHDIVSGIGATDHTQIRYAIAASSNFRPLFGHGDDSPRPSVAVEDSRQNPLQKIVRTFSHSSLLELAIDVVAVVLVHAVQVFVLANRDKRSSRHALSIAQTRPERITKKQRP